MREAYVTEGVNEAALRREAERRVDEVTFIHHHSYQAHCIAEFECYLVQGANEHGPA